MIYAYGNFAVLHLDSAFLCYLIANEHEKVNFSKVKANNWTPTLDQVLTHLVDVC